jgi:hypothetical protein
MDFHLPEGSGVEPTGHNMRFEDIHEVWQGWMKTIILWKDDAFMCGSLQIRTQAIWIVYGASAVFVMWQEFKIFRCWNLVTNEYTFIQAPF